MMTNREHCQQPIVFTRPDVGMKKGGPTVPARNLTQGCQDMGFIVFFAPLGLPAAVLADEFPNKQPATDAAINRGLEFLTKDALAWKVNHNCVSCHHAPMVIWALREAK